MITDLDPQAAMEAQQARVESDKSFLLSERAKRAALAISIRMLEIDQKIDIKNGYIRKKSHGVYVLSDDNNHYRKRWGNLKEIVDDTIYFLNSGRLPAAESEMW